MSQIEASIILLDNSEYARNGDLNQNRWQAQVDAANFITNAKIELNMENGVGFILSGGKQVQLLMTPTNDPESCTTHLYRQQLKGQIHFSVAIYIGQLTLKHRVNKKQKQRIVVFVASPIEEDEQSLINLAKKLKKNNIAVDVVNFGEQNEEHLQKLEKFVETVKKDNNGIFVNVKPGVASVYDYIASAFFSQAEANDQGGQPNQGVPGAPVGGQGAPGNFQEFGGIDPNMDPELAMAIKLSLEEEQQRQQQQPPNAAALQPAQQPAQQPVQQPQPAQQPVQEEQKQQPPQQHQPSNLETIEEEKPLLQQDEDEDEILKQAKFLSMEEQKQDDVFQDEDFVQDLLQSALGEEVSKEELEKLLKKDKDDKK